MQSSRNRHHHHPYHHPSLCRIFRETYHSGRLLILLETTGSRSRHFLNERHEISRYQGILPPNRFHERKRHHMPSLSWGWSDFLGDVEQCAAGFYKASYNGIDRMTRPIFIFVHRKLNDGQFCSIGVCFQIISTPATSHRRSFEANSRGWISPPLHLLLHTLVISIKRVGCLLLNPCSGPQYHFSADLTPYQSKARMYGFDHSFYVVSPIIHRIVRLSSS